MQVIVKSFQELTLQELYEILRIRTSVFVVEQSCPYQEVDNLDQNSYHVMLVDHDQIAAYCRVIDCHNPFKEVSIGRVLSLERRKGYATLVVKKGIEVAIQQYQANKIIIEAQTYARSLYEKVGFKQTSEPFLEDGIEHIQMCYICNKDVSD